MNSRRFRKWRSLLLVVTLLVSLALATTGLAAVTPPTENPPTTIATLAFAEALSDQEVVQLLQVHGVRGDAAFMWAAGLGGVHRVYEPMISALKATGGLVGEARKASTRHFSNGLDANVIRLRKFVEKHTADQVEAHDDLAIQLRSLLNIRYRLDEALRAASAGTPLIYGLAISGSESEVDSAREDQRVSDSGKGERGDRMTPPRRPRAFDRRVEDAHLDGLSGRELHALASAIVGAER